MIDFAGRQVIVTGASSGLGRALAMELATTSGADLVIAARREEKLTGLAKDIAARSDSRVTVVPVDLTDPSGPEYLLDRARSVGQVFGLVNNAGVTHYGRTSEAGWENLDALLEIDLRAVIRLTLLCLRQMIDQGEGAVLNVASLAAFLPAPYQSVYAACKRGVYGFTESLAREVKGSGVIVSSLAPGGIATEMITSSGLDLLARRHPWTLMSAEKVARIAILAWRRGRPLCIPGWVNRAALRLARVLPRRLVARVGERMYRPPSQT